MRDVVLEKPLGSVRPDVSATISGVPIAIEVQISELSIEATIHRTQEYQRKGIYVLWLPQWTPYLDGEQYSPRLWEKWIHAAYFGRVYYWVKGLHVLSYRFQPHFTVVPKNTWYSDRGDWMSAGGYTRKSKRYRTAMRGERLNLVKDFTTLDRDWWKAGRFIVPSAKLYTGRDCQWT